MSSSICWGQTPAWINNAGREKSFPVAFYYTGFAEDALSPNANPAQVNDKVRKTAQSYLAESIQTSLKSSDAYRIRQTQDKDFIKIVSEYNSCVETYSNITITGMQTEVYSEKDKIYAFAFIEKDKIVKYCAFQISESLQNARILLNLDGKNSKQKIEAIRICRDTIPALLAKVWYYQDMISIVNSNAGENLLQRQLSNSIKENLRSMLDQTVSVYVSCEGEYGDRIFNDVKAGLTNNGCTIENSKSKADFSLYIQTSNLRATSKVGNLLFYKADILVEMTDVKTGDIYTFHPEGKEADLTPERAIQRLFERASSEIIEEIVPYVRIN